MSPSQIVAVRILLWERQRFERALSAQTKDFRFPLFNQSRSRFCGAGRCGAPRPFATSNRTKCGRASPTRCRTGYATKRSRPRTARAGQALAERHERKLQRTAARRVLEHRMVCESRRGPGADRRIPETRQRASSARQPRIQNAEHSPVGLDRRAGTQEDQSARQRFSDGSSFFRYRKKSLLGERITAVSSPSEFR